MYKDNDRLVLSPSDLVGYLSCQHLTELSLQVASGVLAPPPRNEDESSVSQKRGMDHERAYLDRLRGEGLKVEEITDDGNIRARASLTDALLREGPDVIYQATFYDDRGTHPAWRGHADFLARVPEPSVLGAFSYEPEDTKLASRVSASAVLQLCEYAEQLERVQGHPPKEIHVVVGDQTKVSLRLADFAAYFRAAKARFEAACSTGVHSYPWRVAHCEVCVWRDQCDSKRVADDHLTLVAGLGREQAERLSDGLGITSMTELAASSEKGVSGIGQAVFEKLRDQARLQVEAGKHPDLPPPYELLESNGPGMGLAALPEPSPGDLFFDIEGDPYVGSSGLEYLLGVGWSEADGTFGFKAFWAHDPAEEKASFEAFIDLVTERQATHPELHIYHYASYERTALGKLMGQYGTREAEVDALFRGNVLVDLHRVVKQSVRVGTPSYSLKKLEALYMESRTQAITDAGSSIDEYERWLETGEDQILADIEEYNRVDCESTKQLRDWLEGRRAEFAATFGSLPLRPSVSSGEASENLQEEVSENDDLKTGLCSDGRITSDSAEADASHLLADLLDWYRREDKPVWWQYFYRVFDCDEEALYEDTEAISGLTYEGVSRVEKRSTVYRYAFDPDQEFKLGPGDRVVDPDVARASVEGAAKVPGPGTIVGIDMDLGELELKRGSNSSAPHPRSVIPRGPVGTTNQREALRRVAKSVIDHGIDGDGPYRAVRDLLLRRPPRTTSPIPQGGLVLNGEDPSDAVLRIGPLLDEGCLSVQGPPGSGKTRAAARLAVALIAAGKTVGVTANSHAVITNLLDEIASQADDTGVTFRGAQKSVGEHFSKHPSIQQRTPNDEMAVDLAGGVQLIAGTAWVFSRAEFDQSLDFLIVDEAGQFSLANALAIGSAARNLVLVGDPRQLAQPSKGTHPDGAGISALEHVIGKSVTLPDDRGVFLDRTYRMHPEICAFISEIIYEDRLHPVSGLDLQAISGDDDLGGSGLRWVPIDHDGDRTASKEEGEAVRSIFNQIQGRTFTDRLGEERVIGLDDILVVAPYNAQVRLLKGLLPQGALVGTVDKFQGRQAPVVICSTTSSSDEEIPRGLEFLLSQNRLNVAVSRAQALAVMVASPKLLTVKCRTVDQLRLANGLCRYAEMAR